MPKTPIDKDQDKGDEVLRRLLKTPPDHRASTKREKPVAPRKSDKKPARTASS